LTFSSDQEPQQRFGLLGQPSDFEEPLKPVR
jgi:hypothetical protein